jgi:uncharacterized protein (UPF0335 family)
MSEPGSNTGIAADELKAFIERIETVETEIAERSGDKRDIYTELKARGFDAKTVRAIIRLRKKDHAERQEEEALLDLYLQSIGMLD